MIAIECISNSTLAALFGAIFPRNNSCCFSSICAMLLKIFPITFRILRTAQVSWQENKFSESLGATGRQKGFAVGSSRRSNRPLLLDGACFASLTFNGG